MRSRTLAALLTIGLLHGCGNDDGGGGEGEGEPDGTLEEACFVRAPENDQACTLRFPERPRSFADVQGQPEFDCGGVDRNYEDSRSVAAEFDCFYCGADENGEDEYHCSDFGFSDDNYWCCP